MDSDPGLSLDERASPLPLQAGSLPRAKVRRVVEHVQAHVDEPLRVADLAALVYLSPFHFSRQFKAATGLAPHAFVLLTRLERARELLAESSLSCSEVATACGFGTQSHFTGTFTRWVGMPPARFRAHMLRVKHAGAPPGTTSRPRPASP